jgi:hypothetical protein
LVAILGWAHSGAHKPDYADWFGLFRVPQITSTDKVAADAYEDRHIFFAYVLLALIVIHVAAAIWHHFVKRDADGTNDRWRAGSVSTGLVILEWLQSESLEYLQSVRVFLPRDGAADNSI